MGLNNQRVVCKSKLDWLLKFKDWMEIMFCQNIDYWQPIWKLPFLTTTCCMQWKYIFLGAFFYSILCFNGDLFTFISCSPGSMNIQRRGHQAFIRLQITCGRDQMSGWRALRSEFLNILLSMQVLVLQDMWMSVFGEFTILTIFFVLLLCPIFCLLQICDTCYHQWHKNYKFWGM